MPAIATKHRKQPDVVERFAGPEARITNRERVSISNFINAEWAEAAMPGDSMEDNAMLYLFPVDDGKYCLQLCYLSYADAPGLNATICSVQFLPEFFDQYSAETLTANLPFRFDRSTEQQFTVCTQTRTLLQQLESASQLTSFIRSLQQSETAMHLLRRALEHITVPFTVCQVPACRFLAYESERDKIQDAVSLIQQNIDQPFTIKELARKVAMNECYLKKGFKTVTGKTIHEYQQELRITKAKELLQQQGHSVTDVADILGYSSISHFSTTFKRVTGMKPCELLS